jgi:hypothetical protein
MSFALLPKTRWKSVCRNSQIPIGREVVFITETLAATLMEQGKAAPLGFLPEDNAVATPIFKFRLKMILVSR